MTTSTEKTRTFTFTLTENEANAILAALSKFPYEQVISIITSIQKQAAEQIDSSVKEEAAEE